MFNVTNYQRNARQNYNEVLPRTGQNGHHQKDYISYDLYVESKKKGTNEIVYKAEKELQM